MIKYKMRLNSGAYKLCSLVSLITLLGSEVPMFELRTKTSSETFTNPGDENSASGRAVIAVDSRWSDVIAVRLVKDAGRDPAAPSECQST